MPSADALAFREVARYWEGVGDEWTDRCPDPVWRSHSDAVNAALLERWLPTHGLRHVLKTDLFDEAVADGLYPVLHRRAQRVTGIDLSPRIVKAAQGRYPLLDGLAADVRRLPFTDGKFDVVVSLSTLDHFDSADEIRTGLLELNRVLAPDGILVVTLDNRRNPAVALRNRLPYPLLRRLGLVPYRVGKTCTPRRLAALLRACSFDVCEVAFVLHCPRVFAVLAARAVDRMPGSETADRFLRLLAGFERVERWPTRALTGYFVAALARRR